MKTQKFYDVCNDAARMTSYCKELTYGSNGYPSFDGVSRFAYYGFDTFEEAEALINTLGYGTIEQIHFRDGWELAESRGVVQEAMEISADDYGDDYSEWHPDDELDFLKEQIEDAWSFDTIVKLVEDFQELTDEFEVTCDNTIVIAHCGKYYATVKTQTMNWSYDTHNYRIAVVINSNDFPEGDGQ